jgi:GTP-binding protein
MPLPLVAIVGRPNVGKSTLFNRLTERRDAIVDDQSGITRDRVYGTANWNGRDFSVIDTGGYVPASSNHWEAAIREQVEIAMDEADLLLYVVDVATGVTDLDERIAALLRKVDKPTLVVANKSDNERKSWDAAEFYSLGLEFVFAVSAINGTGTGELLDEVVSQLPPSVELEKEEDETAVAFIGRPNVGKSSLTNRLAGTHRSIVSEIPGTTRDAVDSVIEHGEHILRIVDTAGLRRKARVKENVEFYSVLRTERAIQRSDVCVLLIDATLGIETQDVKVLELGARMKKGLVVAVNKWDLIEKETNTARDFERSLREKLKTMAYVPVIFISALTGQRVNRVLDLVLDVARERAKRIPTAELNEVVERLVARTPPPSYRSRHVKINYATQVRADPPVISFFCNHPQGIRDSYRRYLENNLRDVFGFEGVPLTLSFKRK